VIARRDFRYGTVTLTLTMSEFREHVEWLEEIADGDGCTKDWRASLNEVDPPEVAAESRKDEGR
jgi:hypothetical protein